MAEPETSTDYAQTVAVWSQLVDVRFRLLALVPTLTAIGVGLLANSSDLGSYRITLVAALGLVSVVAVMIYDLRNSMLHDFATHRLKKLEAGPLKLERTVRRYEPWPDAEDERWPTVLPEDETKGGVFAERPPAANTFLGVRVQHDLALSTIYIGSIGAWATLVAYSGLKRTFGDLSSNVLLWWTVAATAALVSAFAVGMSRYNVRHRYLLHVLTGGIPTEAWPPWTETKQPRPSLRHPQFKKRWATFRDNRVATLVSTADVHSTPGRQTAHQATKEQAKKDAKAGRAKRLEAP